MIKVIQPTHYQIFVSNDYPIDRLESVLKESSGASDYVKYDDVVDGTLGTRFVFFAHTTCHTVNRLVEKFQDLEIKT